MDKYLVYINHVGSNWREHNLYEFLFSLDSKDVEGDDWDIYPASNGDVTPPDSSKICSIGVLETHLDLLVIRDSDTFSVWDAVDRITPLAFENIVDYDEYPENRLVFNFGDTLTDVNHKLYSREIILDVKNIDNENKEE